LAGASTDFAGVGTDAPDSTRCRALPAADIDLAASFARQDKGPSTRAAYKSDFAAFHAYCNSHRHTPAHRHAISCTATRQPL
jgi:hypothetical protein